MLFRCLIIFFLFYTTNLVGQISVTNSAPYNNAEYLVNTILLNSDFETSNQSAVGLSSIGYFDGGSSNIGFDQGVILSSGGINFVSYGSDVGSGVSGDADLESLLNSMGYTPTVNNVAILEFDFVAQANSITFNYVFGSAEYNNCSTVYNDLCGIFLSGPGISGEYSNSSINLALVPEPENTDLYTDYPVSVSNIHSSSCALYPEYNVFWIDNNYAGSDWEGVNQPPNPQFTVQGVGGFTVPLTAEYNNLTIGQTYHIKIAVADHLDSGYNSVLFLQGSYSGCTYELACNYNPTATEDDGSCEFESCIDCNDPEACNYNSNAIIIDNSLCLYPNACGSCEDDLFCYGCTYPGACNYDLEATEDDGSCEFVSCSGCMIESACNYNPEAIIINDDLCLFVEDLLINSDGVFYDCDGICLSDSDDDSVCDEFEIIGCTYVDACNYNPNATQNDEEICIYVQDLPGNNNGVYYDCNGACVIDSNQNGVCDLFEIEGCTYENACNYNPNATQDDNSCVFFVDFCVGCANEDACNYNPNILENDESSCVFIEDLIINVDGIYYDCNGNCILDSDNNGICDLFEITGCMDTVACNYNINATQDDNSCEYESCVGCMDELACNYNPISTISAACVYPEPGFNCLNEVLVGDGQIITLCDGQQGAVTIPLSVDSENDLYWIDSNIYTDDMFGGVVEFGFYFNFYGDAYNHGVISSNSLLSFDMSNAGGYSDWTIGDPVPSTFEADVQNSIMSPWHDTYPGYNSEGNISYTTIGQAPNRVFIVSFCGLPMYSCTDTWSGSQIKIFESTNVIETHLSQKVLCSSWNSGAAIHGLQNQTGTIAHVVTGEDGIERNYPNQWTAQNEGWRFTPNGNNDYIIESIEFNPSYNYSNIVWVDAFGNQIGTGAEISIAPSGNTTVAAYAVGSVNGDGCQEYDEENLITEFEIIFENCIVYGCTDPAAINYDPEATYDDGSCEYVIIYGCMDPNAENYNPNATEEDGSCEYNCSNGETYVILSLYDSYGDGWYGSGGENSYLLFNNVAYGSEWVNPNGSAAAFDGGDQISYGFCLDLSQCYEWSFVPGASYSTECSWIFNDPAGNILNSNSDINGIGSCVYGCMDESACNYDENATIDNGSCDYASCCDIEITFYNINDISCVGANDGSFNYIVSGGTPPYEFSFWPPYENNMLPPGCYVLTVWDINNCITEDEFCIEDSETPCIEPVPGCMDIEACNYNPDANTEDQSCIYIDQNCGYESYGINNAGELITIWSGAINEDCECIENGCTDPAACNYYTEADIDNGTCYYPGDGYAGYITFTIGPVGEPIIEFQGACEEMSASCECCYEETYYVDPEGFIVYEEEYICGCTDPLACNYDSEAIMENNTCLYDPDCGIGMVENQIQKELIHIVDVLGRNVSPNTKNVTLLYIYDDGSMEMKHFLTD